MSNYTTTVVPFQILYEDDVHLLIVPGKPESNEANANAKLESYLLNSTIRSSGEVDGRNLVQTEKDVVKQSHLVSRYLSDNMRRKIIESGKLDNVEEIKVTADINTNYEIKCDVSDMHARHAKTEPDAYSKRDKLCSYESMYGEEGYKCAEYKSVYD